MLDIYDYDDIGEMTYAEVMEKIRALRCPCVAYDDSRACARFRDPSSWGLEEAWGLEHEGCDCDCHDIWSAWVASDD